MKLYWVITFEDLKPKGYAHGLESFERAQSWADGYTSACAERVRPADRNDGWLTSGAVAHGGPEWRDPDVAADWDEAEAMVAKAQAEHEASEAKWKLSHAAEPRTVEQLADLTRRVRDHCAERVHTAATSRRIQEDQRRYHADHDDLRPFEDVSRVLRWVVSWNHRMGTVDRAFDAAVADMRRAR